jgi:hypothetical protein
MTTVKRLQLACTLAAFSASLIMASHMALAQDEKDQSWMIKPTEQHAVTILMELTL